MAERDDIGSESSHNFVDGTAAIAAAQVAAVIGLFFEQTEGRAVRVVSPIHAALFQIFAERFDWPQKLALLHGEGADGELHGRFFREQKQGFKQGERILAAGERHGYAIAIADHLESADGFPDLAQ